jgi:hypothetical protein
MTAAASTGLMADVLQEAGADLRRQVEYLLAL